MPRKKQRSVQSIDLFLRASLHQKTSVIQAGIVQAFMAKDSTISNLKQQNEMLINDISKIGQRMGTNQSEGVQELKMKIEELSEDLKRKDEMIKNNQETIEEFTTKMSNITIKKKIVGNENEKLKTELMTLKHLRMREEKEYKDEIEKLKSEKNLTEDNDNSKQIQVLKKILAQKTSDLETFRKTQSEYVNQFKLVQDMMKNLNQSLKEKDKIIESMKIQLQNYENSKNGIPNVEAKEDEDSTENKVPLKTLSAEYDFKLPKITKVVTLEDSLEDDFDASVNDIEPVESLTPKESTILVRKCDEMNDNFNDDAMTSSKTYSQLNLLNSEPKVVSCTSSADLPSDDKGNLLCPLPDCKSIGKFPKLSFMRNHIAQHFSKELRKKFNICRNESQCRLCKVEVKTVSGLYYHYGFKHREINNLLEDSDPRKALLKPYMKA